MRDRLLVLVFVTIGGCGAGVDPAADESGSLQACDFDNQGGGCIRTPPPRPRNLAPANESIPMICKTDAAHFPAPIDSKNWDGVTSLWRGHHGVLVPFYTPNTVDTQSRVQVFGVDVKTRQIIFSVFTDAAQAAPWYGPLQTSNAGSDDQHPNCPGDRVPVGQGQVKAGSPPAKPPVSTAGGPTCFDGVCDCTIDIVLRDALSRACPTP